MKTLMKTALGIVALLAISQAAQASQYDDRFAYDTIVGFYQRYLKRSPQPHEVRSHLRGMRQNGISLRELEAGFLASPEYFMLHRRDPRWWVRGMIEDVYDRDPDPGEMRSWMRRLDQFDGDRTRLAREVLDSTRGRYDGFDDWDDRSPRRRYPPPRRYPAD
jgi:hypothetical protein